MAYITNISSTTLQRRRTLKALQDEFSSFSWGGEDAFENFGAFIINDKNGSLKFYNGPGFSNEYTKPQFDNAGGMLQGVTFNKQSISFNVGVYWISIEDYRKFLQWLHPLKIDYLQFGFDKKFRYDVKLSKIGDSTRWIVGKENGEPRYYTELPLTFELQGTPCAKGIYGYEFKGTNDKGIYWDFKPIDNSERMEGTCFLDNTQKEFIPSDLDTPLQVHFSLNLKEDYIEANYFYDGNAWQTVGIYYPEFVDEDEESFSDLITLESDLCSFTTDNGVECKQTTNDQPTEYDIDLSVEYNYNENGQERKQTSQLCFMTLQHVTHFLQEGYSLNFTYISESGLVFIKSDRQSQGTLLSLQTYSDSGLFLVKQLYSTKFTLPGNFNYPGFYDFTPTTGSVQLKLRITKRVKVDGSWTEKNINESTYKQPVLVECYPRTNVI